MEFIFKLSLKSFYYHVLYRKSTAPKRLNELFYKTKAMKLISNRLLKSKTNLNPYLLELLETPMIEVAVLSDGQSFGELALISNKPRAASIKTKSNCYFAVLNKEDYQNVYGVIERNHLNKKIDLLKSWIQLRDLTRDTLSKMTYYFEEITLTRNNILYREGDPWVVYGPPTPKYPKRSKAKVNFKIENDAQKYCYIVISGELEAYKEHKIHTFEDKFESNTYEYVKTSLMRIDEDYYRNALKEKYLKEVAQILSKNWIGKYRFYYWSQTEQFARYFILAKYGPGTLIGDIECLLNEPKWLLSIKWSTVKATLFRIKNKDFMRCKFCHFKLRFLDYFITFLYKPLQILISLKFGILDIKEFPSTFESIKEKAIEKKQQIDNRMITKPKFMSSSNNSGMLSYHINSFLHNRP